MTPCNCTIQTDLSDALQERDDVLDMLGNAIASLIAVQRDLDEAREMYAEEAAMRAALDQQLARIRATHGYLHDVDCLSNIWGEDGCACSGQRGTLAERRAAR